MRYLRQRGLSLSARVLSASATGVEIGDIPVYRLTVQVADRQGPYEATVDKVLREHEVQPILGTQLHVLVNPANPADLILDD